MTRRGGTGGDPAGVEQERELSREDYELFRKLIYEKSGINLGDQKQQLVRARLGKRLRQGGFGSYRDYYNHVKNDPTGAELSGLIDSISTNTTHLFREKQHFEFLSNTVKRWMDDRRWRNANDCLRIWSAGCSSGDEPYSIAMTIADAVGERGGLNWKILATDISTRILDRAKAGIYESHRLGTVPGNFRQRFFVRAANAERGTLQVSPTLRNRITFSYFNLMVERFPFRHGFHFIFCRNVMIYFDRPTQERLVHKYTQHLRPGGHLLIGHSESLNGIQHSLGYVQPTVYQRSGG